MLRVDSCADAYCFRPFHKIRELYLSQDISELRWHLHTLVASQPRYGEGGSYALYTVLLTYCPSRLSWLSYCDVSQAFRYFASSFRTLFGNGLNFTLISLSLQFSWHID
jgi:hypothetical protein